MSLEAEYTPGDINYCDFSGYVVKYDVKNEDGYSIAKDAFKENDKKSITIVNNFYEGIPVGICLLSNDDVGLYGRCFLKNFPNAQDVLQDVREGMVDAFIVNLEKTIIDTKDPKTVLSGTIKNIMMDQHENSKYVSSIEFVKDITDCIPNPDETIADYVERTTPNKPLKYEPEIDDKIPDFVNKEMKRSMKEELNKEYYRKVTLTRDDIKDPHDFHALPWTVDILGTRYNIKSVDRNTDDKRLEGANAYCDYYAKEIVAIKYEETEESFKDIPAFNRKTLRHEIIHAFLAESGLRRSCSWAENEEVVDWIAIQFPKMLKAFQEANAINSEDLK